MRGNDQPTPWLLAKTRNDAGYVSCLNVSVALIKALGGGWSGPGAGRRAASD
jgi:hypothetical protein